MTSPVSIVRITAPGIQGPPGTDTTSGTIAADQIAGVLTVAVVSNWGITDADSAYYDTAGADPDEAAIATVDDAGHLTLTSLSES